MHIEINSQPVDDLLNRLIQSGQNMHPVMDAIGMELEKRVSDRFETKTDPIGNAWAPWKPSTVKSYPKDGNKRLLDRRGDLLGSLSYQSDGNSVFIGFGAVSDGNPPFPYPAAHELGTRNMERRGMLMADPIAGTLGGDDEDAVLRLLNEHFG